MTQSHRHGSDAVPSDARRRAPARRWVCWLAVGVWVAFGMAAELRSVVRPDIGFLLDAAGRVLDGAKLYVDVVEINPPLIVALNIPPVIVARALDVSAIVVYRLGFAAVLLGALALIWRTLGRAVAADRAVLRYTLLVLCAFVLFPLSAQDFGQREHLLLALVLPYLLSASGRLSGRDPNTAEAIGIGVAAGIAFALKPHFLLLWLVVDLFVRLSRPADRWRVMPESAAILLVLVLYGVAVLVFTPDYLRLVMLVAADYNRFLRDPFFRLLVTAPGAVLAWLALLAYIALRRRARHRQLWTVLALGVLTCFLGGALQQKGLRYHFFPSFALAIVVLGLVAVDVEVPLQSAVQRIYHTIALSLVITAMAVVTVENLGQALLVQPSVSDRELRELVRLVRERAAGGSIFVMSYHIGSAYPLINYSGVRSASRFPQLWMLPASYMDELKADRPLRYRAGAAMPATERYLNDAVLADLERNRPTLLVVLRHARDLAINGYRRIDYLAYFGRDPRFRAIFAQYEHIADVGEHAVYGRIQPGQTRVGAAPAGEPGTHDVVRADQQQLQQRLQDPAFLLRALVFLVVTIVVAYAGGGSRRIAVRP